MQCPEPGLYMFTLTVCTYDGKKCLLILRKNEKDVCALIDQVRNNNMTGGILLSNLEHEPKYKHRMETRTVERQ